MNLLRSITSGLVDEIFQVSAAIIILIGGAAQQSQELRTTGHTSAVTHDVPVVKKQSKFSRLKSMRASLRERMRQVSDSIKNDKSYEERYKASLIKNKEVREILSLYCQERPSTLLTPHY